MRSYAQYNLRSVCTELLEDTGENKDDMHFTEIEPAWKGNSTQRARMFKYNHQVCTCTFR